MGDLHVEYCGEWTVVRPESTFRIGRTGDLAVDDNPYLHRSFLELRHQAGVWLAANVGRTLSATISDPQNHFVAHLAPGGVLPLAFDRSIVRFSAGTTSYELQVILSEAPFERLVGGDGDVDELAATTRGPVSLSPDQKLLVLALAEHALRRTGTGPTVLPTTGEAARRVGWTEKKFNKKLDALCQKLAAAGVRGVHGEPGRLASNRRARLVEYCMSARLVVIDDLELLRPDRPARDAASGPCSA
jgi:hypothetical protein